MSDLIFSIVALIVSIISLIVALYVRQDDQMNRIPDTTLMNICKIGKGEECCRYIVADKEGPKCAKGSSLEPIIDLKVSRKEMISEGDNCPGLLRSN